MTPPDQADPRSAPDLPALPGDTEGPVFQEPWEAEAFAMAVRLHEAGYFTWRE
ncbi:MAG: nitrile hydratase accessory protein, partial [candidate division NC10 bacterium]